MKARLNALAASLLLTAAGAPGQSLYWVADMASPRPAAFSVYRGDAVPLEASIRAFGSHVPLAGAECTFHWQTNGMGAAWWTAPAAVVTGSPDRVRYVWAASNDCGAAAYTFFFRASPTNGMRHYTANGTLAMLPSPGAEPNALPLPVPSIDFSAVAALNAPWPSAADLQAATNALAAAVQPLGPRLDLIEAATNDWRTAYSWGDHSLAGYLLPADIAGLATTQHVAEAVAAIPRDRIITQDGSQWIDATGGVWRVSSGGGGYWTISILGTLYGSATNAYYEVRSAPFDFWTYDQAYWDGDAYFRWYPDGAPGHGKVYVEIQGEEGSHDYNYPTNDIADGVFEFYMSSTYTHFVLAWSNDLASVSTQRVDGLAWQSDLAAVTTNYVPLSEKELRADSFTNLIWRSVFSNGWHFLVAHTNTPGGAE